MDKKTVYLGVILGSLIGGYIPVLFGAGIFSLASIAGDFFGAIFGLWLTVKLLS